MIQFTNAISRFDDLILKDVRENANIDKVWVAGGAVRDHFSIGRIATDVDLYFPGENYLTKVYKYFKDNNYDLFFENENVYKFKRPSDNLKIDLIRKFFDSPKDTINNFDFTICCAAIDHERVYTHNTFFIDLAKKQLMINALPYPMSTLWRIQKYIWKGYRMCQEEMYKVAHAISEMEIHKQNQENEEENTEIELGSGEGGSMSIFAGMD